MREQRAPRLGPRHIIQGAIKVIVVSGHPDGVLPMVWMGAAAVVPFGAFLLRRTFEPSPSGRTR